MLAADSSFAQAPVGKLESVTIESKKVFDEGFNDFQYFSRVALPDVVTFDWPALYIQIWILLVKAIREKDHNTAKRVIRFALGLPRGFAKTTFMKLLVAWLIVYDMVTFVLIVCATERHSENFLADVSEILSSPNMVKVYGNWPACLSMDNASMKKAQFRRRNVILAAVGAGTSVRGLNIFHERPDFLLCDDMQTKENAKSDNESAALLEWFIGTLVKCVDPVFSVITYVGNMYPQNCILYKLKENKYWTSLITGCILQDGKSLWEELKPLEALFEDYKHDEALNLAHIWFAEMMNDPILERLSLLPNGVLPNCPITEEELVPDAGFCIIDPAGFKKASDDNVAVAKHVMGGICYTRGLVVGNLNPKELIHQTIALCLRFDIRIIFVEAIGYQQTLKFWFEEELKRLDMAGHFFLVELPMKHVLKDTRIRLQVKAFLSQTSYIFDTEARQKYIFQALQYKIGKKNNHDDILDAEAYEQDIRAEHWDFVHSVPLNAAVPPLPAVVGNNTPF